VPWGRRQARRKPANNCEAQNMPDPLLDVQRWEFYKRLLRRLAVQLSHNGFCCSALHISPSIQATNAAAASSCPILLVCSEHRDISRSPSCAQRAFPPMPASSELESYLLAASCPIFLHLLHLINNYITLQLNTPIGSALLQSYAGLHLSSPRTPRRLW